MRIDVPKVITEKIAQRAVDRAVEYGERRGWNSPSDLEPYADNGIVGVRVPRRIHHLIYQNYGTNARVMWELEGKVIPMGDGRFIRAVGVGQPGYVTLPDGRQIWRDRKWEHPGIKPTHFIEEALEESMQEGQSEIESRLRGVIRR